MADASHHITNLRFRRPTLFAILLSIAVLYWAQKIIIPLALAVLVAFLLAPVVSWLQQRKLPRFASVLIVVFLALALLYGALRVVFMQVGELAHRLPDHTHTITQKIEELRTNKNYLWNQLGLVIQDVNQDLRQSGIAAADEKPLPVIFKKDSLNGLSLFPMIALPLFEGLLTLVFILVLVVYILVKHEDLRDRLLRVAGRGQMALTATALDEAGTRIGKLMLLQLAVNIGFGLLFWLGLALIGVPYAFLWGFLTALLRFVPYLGTTLALCFPLIFSFAVFPGWTQPLLIVGWFLILESLIGYVLEPLFFSDSAGVSPIALLVAAAFWTWLWGPLGLVLSNPMTVCLVVLGRHVPQLRFFDILMSPRNTLEPADRYYHMLLARDQEEAVEMLQETLRQRPLDVVCDRLLIPALVLAKQDRVQEEIPPCEEEALFQAMRETFAESAVRKSSSDTPPAVKDVALPKSQILVCSGTDNGDGLAGNYFEHALTDLGYPVEVAASDKLTAEVGEQVKRKETLLVCLVVVVPNNLSELRRCCKRVRAESEQVKILVVLCGHTNNPAGARSSLATAGADAVAFSMVESCQQVKTLLGPARERRAAG
jgi:predicted PurR-regulated permease PerM